jgi:hypothetical protein
VYLPVDGYVKFAHNFLDYKFHILVQPSSRPAHRNSEFLENITELTGVVAFE